MAKKKKPKGALVAKIPDLKKFIGRTVEINGQTIKIETCVGNVGMTLGRAPKDQRPQFAEINGRFRISFLRLLAQMYGETYTEEEYRDYENMEFWSEPNKEQEPEETELAAAKIVDDIMMKGKKDG